MPVTKKYLLEAASSTSTFFKGNDYYRQGHVRVLQDEVDDKGIHTITASVKGHNGDAYEVYVSLYRNESELCDYSCTCPAFKKYDGACKHVVATVLQVEEEHTGQLIMPKHGQILKMQAEKSRTDEAAIELIRRCAQRSITLGTTDPNSPLAVLKPVLEIDADTDVLLSFKIGVSRMYVLKDLKQFKADMQNGAQVDYGKQFSFVHDISGFEETSKPFVRFLLSYAEENRYSALRYYYTSSDLKRLLFLTPHMLDEFFKLVQDDHLQMCRNGVTEEYAVKKENPHLSVSLHKKGNGRYHMLMQTPIVLLKGLERNYIVKDHTLYCCTPQFSSHTTDFLTTMRANKRGLFISEGDMRALSSTVFASIRPYIEIASNDDLSRFQPPVLVSKVYFDMPSPNFVTAKLKFFYGEEKHDAFRPKNVSQSSDIRGETYAESVLQKYLPDFDTTHDYVFINQDEGAIYQLVNSGLSEIASFAEIYATDAFNGVQVRPPATVSVGIRVKSNLLELAFDIGDVELAELTDILHSYRQTKKYHRLRDGSFVNLENSALAEFSALAEGLDLSDKELLKGRLSIPQYRALYLDTLVRQSERMKYDRDSEFKRMVRDLKDVSDADFAVPPTLKSVLRNYQKIGYRWLRTMAAYGFGGILADDMGLGKTLQVIALLQAQKAEQKEHTVSLVICPSSLTLNWESEIKKFAPSLKAETVIGSAAERAELLKQTDTIDVFITSYDLIKRDVELYKELIFEYQIIDEAQYIKNHTTQNAKAVKAVNSKVRFALTGTPIENTLAELWSIYDYLMPGYLFTYSKFKQKYEMPIVRTNESAALENLRKLVQPFILRRLKKDVLTELPEKTETILYASMEEAQKNLYLANAAEAKKKLAQEGENDLKHNKLMVFAMLTKLRQVCCDPCLLYENYAEGSAKLELCMELIGSCIDSGHKLLLFSQFTSMLQIIEDRLVAQGISFYKIVGATKVSERLALVDAFNADATSVFLISLKAGGTGLNLTGADVVIHYDPWWNSSAQNQATDRVHRIGQKNSVQVYDLIVKNTIEEKILKMQQDKSELADLIIQENSNMVTKMSKQQLLQLFE